MFEFFKYVVATFGGFGAFLMATYFLVSKIPKFLEGFDQLSEKKYKRLEKILENEKLSYEVKRLTSAILDEEYINRATSSNLSRSSIEILNDVYEKCDKGFRIKDVLSSSYIVINTVERTLEFRKVSEGKKEIFYYFGFIYLYVTLIFFTFSITLVMSLMMREMLYPQVALSTVLKNFLHFMHTIDNLFILASIMSVIATISFKSLREYGEISKALAIKKVLDSKNITYISID